MTFLVTTIALVFALAMGVAGQAPFGQFINTNYGDTEVYLNYMCADSEDPTKFYMTFWEAGYEYGTVVNGTYNGKWIEVGYLPDNPTYQYGTELGSCNGTACTATWGTDTNTTNRGEWTMIQTSAQVLPDYVCWSDETASTNQFSFVDKGPLYFEFYDDSPAQELLFNLTTCVGYGVSEWGYTFGGILTFQGVTYEMNGLCPFLLIPDRLCTFSMTDKDGNPGVGMIFIADRPSASVWLGSAYNIDFLRDTTKHVASITSSYTDASGAVCQALYPPAEDTQTEPVNFPPGLGGNGTTGGASSVGVAFLTTAAVLALAV